MPNWVENFVWVYYDTSKGRDVKYIEKLKEAVEQGRLLDFLKPMPKHQPDVDKPNAFFATGDLGQEQRKLYGENNWYDWSVRNWGTKWDVSDARVIGEGVDDDGKHYVHITFFTAWAPPAQALNNLKYDYDLEFYMEGEEGFGKGSNY